MARNLWPADAVSGSPNYTGRMLRQTLGGLWTKASNRLLGARSGIHPAAGATAAAVVTATSTTWTVKPHTGVLDLETNAIAGPYDYSFDANQTGAVTAADATNPRVDSLFVQLSDPAEGDGTATPDVTCVYAAGTPGTPGGARGAAGGPPNFPNTRCMELAQLNVPISGGGSPSVSLVAMYTGAVGSIIPVRTSAEYPTNPYQGQYVDSAVLNALVRYDGSNWVPLPPPLTVSGTPPFGSFDATKQVKETVVNVSAAGDGTNGITTAVIGETVAAILHVSMDRLVGTDVTTWLMHRQDLDTSSGPKIQSRLFSTGAATASKQQNYSAHIYYQV